MKKKAIQLGVVLALLIAAVVAYFVLSRPDDGPATTSPAEEIYVLGGIPQPFVKEVAVQNEVDSFRIVNGYTNAVEQYNNAQDSKFSLDGMDTQQLTMSMLQSVVNTAANLTAKKEVNVEGGNLAVYGLDTPVATMKVTYENSEAQLRIGSEAPGGEGTYVAVGDKVYLVGTTKLTNLLGSRLNFASKMITPGNSQATVLTRAEISGTAYAQPIVIEKSAVDDQASAMMGTGTYRITSPIQSATDMQNGVSSLMTVFGLSASQVVGTVANGLDQWGLEQPYASIQVTTEDADTGSFLLSVSAPVEGSVYLMVNTSSFVYQLPAEALPWLSKTLFDFQEKMVLLPHIDNVARVEVKAADRVHTFSLSGEGAEMKVTADGEELSTDIFRNFYQTLISATYDAEVPEEDTGEKVGEEDADVSDTAAGVESETPPVSAAEEEQPAIAGEILLQYTYHYLDGSPADVVTFRPGSARRVIVTLNDGRGYLAKSTYVDRVLEDLPKVLTGQEVKSFY